MRSFMKFFTKEASKALRTKKGNAEWENRLARYERHLIKICPTLTAAWRRVAKTDFHDSKVFSFGQWQFGEFILNIDMFPRWKEAPLGICSLRFGDVRKLDVPEEVLKDWLIYTEVHALRGGAEFRGLCANFAQFRIAGKEVRYFLNYDRASSWR